MLLLIRKYDQDYNGKLTFNEVATMLLSKDQNYSKLVLERKAYNQGSTFLRTEPFTPETQMEFVNLLMMLVQTEVRCEQVRQQLRNRKDFKFNEAFASIDKKGKGGIGKAELAAFMELSHYYPTEREMTLLIERFDKNNNGFISYAEFVEELTPRIEQAI